MLFHEGPHSDESLEDSGLEFRSPLDDAWYKVDLVLDGDKLTARYCDLDQYEFHADEIDSLRKLEELAARFRPTSRQLQDSECRTVVKGRLVCASHDFDSDDCLNFYDAVVLEVEHKAHSVVKGAEVCLCTFKLFWQHGPMAGLVMNKSIENVTLVQSNAQLDSTVTSFLNIARKKIEKICTNPSAVCGNVATCNSNAVSSMQQNKKRKRQFVGGRIGGGRFGNFYSILVENLEKELTALTMVEFVHKKISLSPEVYVVPTFSSETYTRAIITMDCQKDFVKLCELVDNPNHIIVSARGRPWVIGKRMLKHDAFSSSTKKSIHKNSKGENGNERDILELKVVPSGSEEHTRAQKLQVLFMEFKEHVQRLHGSLNQEEKNIMEFSHQI